jgi:DnaJ-class molecular chaperone
MEPVDEPEHGVCRSCDGTGIEGIDRGECAPTRCGACKGTGNEP